MEFLVLAHLGVCLDLTVYTTPQHNFIFLAYHGNWAVYIVQPQVQV